MSCQVGTINTMSSECILKWPDIFPAKVRDDVRPAFTTRESSSVIRKLRVHARTCRKLGVPSSATTAWEFSQDLGNLGVRLGIWGICLAILGFFFRLVFNFFVTKMRH